MSASTGNVIKGVKGFRQLHGQAIGKSRSPTYMSWCAMRSRCLSKTHRNYAYYGGRGISICDRWNCYENFVADMGERPSKLHTLDRFPNNDGHYEPGNCRWATKKEQRANQRKPKTAWFHDITGQTFGLLTAIEIHSRHASNGLRWRCICVCGNARVALSGQLRSGNVQSCGCLPVGRRAALKSSRGDL